MHFTTALEVIEHSGPAAPLVRRGRKTHALPDVAARRTLCGREHARQVSPKDRLASGDGCKVCTLCLVVGDHGPWEATYDTRLLRELGLTGPS